MANQPGDPALSQSAGPAQLSWQNRAQRMPQFTGGDASTNLGGLPNPFSTPRESLASSTPYGAPQSAGMGGSQNEGTGGVPAANPYNAGNFVGDSLAGRLAPNSRGMQALQQGRWSNPGGDTANGAGGLGQAAGGLGQNAAGMDALQAGWNAARTRLGQMSAGDQMSAGGQSYPSLASAPSQYGAQNNPLATGSPALGRPPSSLSQNNPLATGSPALGRPPGAQTLSQDNPLATGSPALGRPPSFGGNQNVG